MHFRESQGSTTWSSKCGMSNTHHRRGWWWWSNCNGHYHNNAGPNLSSKDCDNLCHSLWGWRCKQRPLKHVRCTVALTCCKLGHPVLTSLHINQDHKLIYLCCILQCGSRQIVNTHACICRTAMQLTDHLKNLLHKLTEASMSISEAVTHCPVLTSCSWPAWQDNIALTACNPKFNEHMGSAAALLCSWCQSCKFSVSAMQRLSSAQLAAYSVDTQR